MQYGEPPAPHCPWPAANRLGVPRHGVLHWGANGGWPFPPGHLKNWKEDRMRPHGARFLTLMAVAASAAMVASCSSSSSSSTGGGGTTTTTKAPIIIGTSLSQTGDFSVDGQAFERGYNLWVQNVNKSGGLLGHKVTLKVLNDNSDPATA